MDVAVFGPNLLDGGELGALTRKGDAHSTFLPGIATFLKCGIVEFTAVTYDKRHCLLLLGSRFELVFIRLAHRLLLLLYHVSLFCLIAMQSASREGHSSP